MVDRSLSCLSAADPGVTHKRQSHPSQLELRPRPPTNQISAGVRLVTQPVERVRTIGVMNTIEVLTIGVAVIGGVAALASYLHAPGGFADLGRTGQTWFDRIDDHALADRPSEDDRDAPLPRRRLRGRPD